MNRSVPSRVFFNTLLAQAVQKGPDARRRFERRLRRRNPWGEVRKGAVEAPSEESLRRRWAFFNSLLDVPRPRCSMLRLLLRLSAVGEASRRKSVEER